MTIKLNFYDCFSCTGGSCQYTCCAGWRIGIDNETLAFYDQFPGEFGKELRDHIKRPGESEAEFCLSDDRRCYFLNEDNLCRVYRYCGEGKMPLTCRQFPRANGILGEFEVLNLSVLCEEVLRILFEQERCFFQLGCVEEKNKTMEEFPPQITFCMWAGELLQDRDAELGVQLSILGYIFEEACESLNCADSVDILSLLAKIPEVEEQFSESKILLKTEEYRLMAEKFIFSVIDTYCCVVHESNFYMVERGIYDDEIFARSDSGRFEYIRECLAVCRVDRTHISFLRKLFSAYLMGQCLHMRSGEMAREVMHGFMNYTILATVLPAMWSGVNTGDQEYFIRLAQIGRFFTHSMIVKKFIHPVIRDLFHPNLYTYALVYLYLFGVVKEEGQ